MKKILNSNFTAKQVDVALLITRIAIGGMMLVHGLPKLMMLFSGDPVQFPGVMGMSPEISLGLAIFAEVLCSILLIVGFGTRLATIPLIVTMAVAVFIFHAADPFATQEPGLHYLLVYLVLLLLGSGKYSVDAALVKQKA